MGSRLEEIIKERERKKFLSELQSAVEREGHIPPMPALFLRKIEKQLQYAGGFFLGLVLRDDYHICVLFDQRYHRSYMIFRRTTEKEDNLLNIVRNLRQDIREKVKEETLSEYDEARKEGKYPWEGMWLKPELISLVQEKLRKKNKVVLIELSVLFFILAFFILPFFSAMTVSFSQSSTPESSVTIPDKPCQT